MNKSQSKYYNTACLMDEALLQLLEHKDFDYITVKEVCQKAGVNRSTFYLHYENMTDLLQESHDYILQQFNSKYDNVAIDKNYILTCPLEELYLIKPKYLVPYLEFIKEHKKVFLTMVNKPTTFAVDKYFDKMYEEVFYPILMRFGVPEKERRYLMAFCLSGIHSIIIQWVKNSCQDEVSFVADFIMKCVSTMK